MAIKYRVVGHSSVENNLRKAAAESKDAGERAYKWAQGKRAELKSTKYPSYLSHFKHKRTGALANGWAVVKNGRNAFAIENRATSKFGFPYAVVVVGNAQGKRIGRANHPSFKRWWIAREIIDEDIEDLRDEIRDAIVDKGSGK